MLIYLFYENNNNRPDMNDIIHTLEEFDTMLQEYELEFDQKGWLAFERKCSQL